MEVISISATKGEVVTLCLHPFHNKPRSRYVDSWFLNSIPLQGPGGLGVPEVNLQGSLTPGVVVSECQSDRDYGVHFNVEH